MIDRVDPWLRARPGQQARMRARVASWAWIWLVSALTVFGSRSQRLQQRRQSPPSLRPQQPQERTEQQDPPPGHAAQHSVVFDALEVTLGSQVILEPCSGRLSPGRLVGVLGPSGAGKSTLLGALSGSTSAGHGKALSGNLHFGNGDPILMDQGGVGFLAQDDTFFSMLTVRETLLLAAALQMPHASKEGRASQVDNILDQLGLADVAHSRVGERRRGHGISGGERRRLSVACELVATPRFLVADEPTTG